MEKSLADSDQVLQRIAPMLGKPGPVSQGPDLVNQAMIRHWCAAIGDRNPVYTSEELSKRSVYQGIIAPPAMLQAWIMPGFGVPYVDDHVFSARAVLDECGYTSVVATNVDQEYFRPLRPGDGIRLTRTLTEVSEEKRTALGPGRFVSSRYDFMDAAGVPVAVMSHRSLKFKPQTGGDVRTAHAKPSTRLQSDSGQPVLPVRMDGDERRIGFPGEGGLDLPTTVTTRDVKVGTRLSPLDVDITRSFIVASAIATRDYQEVHHDPDIARDRGSKDIFTNILTSTGLIGRLVTDSLGPDALLHGISVQLGMPNYPQDRLRLSGVISDVSVEGERDRVRIEITGDNTLGRHLTAKCIASIRH